MSAVTAAVIGGGPAGLMAAEILAKGGARVDVFDSMPSVGRKFLLAGVGGMNITHAEPFEDFVSRYSECAHALEPLLATFGPAELRDWIHGLGIETFVGSSHRVFPREMKAAPLLRAWLHRLRQSGVRIHTRHRWQGWDDSGALSFQTRDGLACMTADVVVLALGGGSWARLGSDGAWVPWLREKGVAVRALRPSNCGFDVRWSEHFRERHAGEPLKSVVVSCLDAHGNRLQRKGELIVTRHGVEGSLVYAMSAPLRDVIRLQGHAIMNVDLLPDRRREDVIALLSAPRGSKSFSEHLRRRLNIKGASAGLLREALAPADLHDPQRVADALKAFPLRLERPRPLDEAISSAGGVAFDALNNDLMMQFLPGVFCAGEMLDWEAPTGGYLLTACFSTGRRAGEGALRWLASRQTRH